MHMLAPVRAAAPCLHAKLAAVGRKAGRGLCNFESTLKSAISIEQRFDRHSQVTRRLDQLRQAQKETAGPIPRVTSTCSFQGNEPSAPGLLFESSGNNGGRTSLCAP